ncbi:MAG: MaoC family dehydratase N-terminal domain-containing protein [Sphingomonadaceae bacterium]
MAIDRKHIGEVSEPRVIEVEKGQLRFFAKATNETNPIYFDEEAAKAAGHPALPAPPTFVFSLALGAPAKRGNILDAENGMGVDMRRILHGEQRFEYHRQIYAGDRVTLVTTTSEIYDKKGGALEFIAQDTTATNDAGELLVTMRSVTVVRNG